MLIEKLQAAQDFTANEKQLAKYVLEHADAVSGMTVRALAGATFVSPSTVTRMCQKLGFDNYSGFKVRLATECTELYQKLGEVDANYPFEEKDTPQQVVDKLAKLSIGHILAVQENMDYNTMSRVVRGLRRSKSIDFYGVGASLSCAFSFMENMLRIGYSTNIRRDFADQRYHACVSDHTNFAIVVSYSGLSPIPLQIIQLLHERKVPTLLLTANSISPMKQYATFVLPIYSSENFATMNKLDTSGSKTAIRYLLDCLFALVFIDDYQKHMKSLDRVKKHTIDFFGLEKTQ